MTEKEFSPLANRGTDKNEERKKPNAQRSEKIRDFEIKSKNNRTLTEN